MSEKVNSLSVNAERFFIRLIMKVDDYGLFHANPKLLKANLFPLLLDGVREADISRWTTECQKAGLILFYKYEGKEYLQIIDFRQRLDKARNKYPLPTANDSVELVNEFPAEVEVERNKNKKENAPGVPSVPVFSDEQVLAFSNLQEWIKKNAPRVNEMKEVLTIDQFFKLKELADSKTIIDVFQSMHNRKSLLKDYQSCYLTANNWIKRRLGDNNPGPLDSVTANAIDQKAMDILNSVNS